VTVFVDTNVPMYVAGRAHRYKEPSRRFLEDVARRSIQAASDVEVLQEILYRYRFTGEIEKGFRVFESFAETMPQFFPVLLEDAFKAKEILRSTPGIPPRDAIHAAIVHRVGIRIVVSYDRHFDRIAGIQRVEPGAPILGGA